MTKSEIQRVRSLREKAARDALGLFAVEGPKVVGELLAAGYAFESIYATAGWEPARVGAEIHRVSEVEMARLSQLPTPSPVLALARIRREPLAPGALDRGRTLALDGIQDPGNVGTLLRIADWFGVDRVLLSPACADPYSAKVVAASMGSFARVTLHSLELAPALAATKASILGCELDGDNIHEVKPMDNVIIAIGSEGQGLSSEVRKLLSRRVTIPRGAASARPSVGAADSLNAGVAAAIICDNLCRKPE